MCCWKASKPRSEWREPWSVVFPGLSAQKVQRIFVLTVLRKRAKHGLLFCASMAHLGLPHHHHHSSLPAHAGSQGEKKKKNGGNREGQCFTWMVEMEDRFSFSVCWTLQLSCSVGRCWKSSLENGGRMARCAHSNLSPWAEMLQHFLQAEVFQKIITTAATSYFPFFYLLVEGKSQK